MQGDDEPDEQARLQALLLDDPVTLPPGDSAAARTTTAADSPTSDLIPPDADVAGAWSFDDCSTFSTHLSDELQNHNAYRSVEVRCTEGVAGSQAIAIAAPEDIAYLPDQPTYTFEAGVTVAGWFKPTAINGTRTLFRKRDKGTSSFALLLNAGKFELVLGFGPGRAVSVTAPDRAVSGVFQHVAGTYDGSTARLYINGVEVNHFDVPGTIPVGPGPLLMGNDGSERRFDGAIDSVVFATHALTAAHVAQLQCVPAEPSLTLSPDPLPETPVGTPVTLDVALTNRSSAVCAPVTFSVQTFLGSDGVEVGPSFAVSAPVPSGATGHLTVTATATNALDPAKSFFVFVSESSAAFGRFLSISFLAIEPE